VHTEAGSLIFSVFANRKKKAFLRWIPVKEKKHDLIVEVRRVIKLDLNEYIKRNNGDKKACPIWTGMRMKMTAPKDVDSLTDILPLETTDQERITELTGFSFSKEDAFFQVPVRELTADKIVSCYVAFAEKNLDVFHFKTEPWNYSKIFGYVPEEHAMMCIEVTGNVTTKLIMEKEHSGFLDSVEITGEYLSKDEVIKKLRLKKIIDRALGAYHVDAKEWHREKIQEFFA
jgi:hypothetical protein